MTRRAAIALALTLAWSLAAFAEPEVWALTCYDDGPMDEFLTGRIASGVWVGNGTGQLGDYAELLAGMPDSLRVRVK